MLLLVMKESWSQSLLCVEGWVDMWFEFFFLESTIMVLGMTEMC